ncbi:MAG TPA: UDP-N-acetylmuramate dehydrogenase [Ktedonobacterales bacterium]
MSAQDGVPYSAHDAFLEVRALVDGRAKAMEPLAQHGTFGVGGPADVWVSVATEDELAQLMTLAWNKRIPLLIVGNGTNTLYADAGARGIVARVAIEQLEVQPRDEAHALLRAGAGASLPALVKKLAAQGWAGLEWSAGVPGTVGGAIVSNAGAHGACIADTIVSARTLLAPGAPGGEASVVVARELSAADLGLGYRQSRFRSNRLVTFDDEGHPHAPPRALIEPQEIIVEATFLLRRDEPAAITSRAQSYLDHRRRTQPPQKSAGSVFKNPEPEKSGRLIEAAGLKPYRIGGAEISAKHANFIINAGGATAADITALMALARRTVRERYGIELELEVEPRGDW